MSVTKVAPSVQDIPEGRVVARSGGGSIQRSDTQSTAGASCSSFSEPSSPQSSSATSVASSPSETSLPRPALLDMDAVHDVATLDLLLGQFESYKSVPQLAPIIPDLMKRPLALEVVLAGMSAVLPSGTTRSMHAAAEQPQTRLCNASDSRFRTRLRSSLRPSMATTQPSSVASQTRRCSPLSSIATLTSTLGDAAARCMPRWNVSRYWRTLRSQ